MALSLSQAVHDTEDVAAGLQIFEDNVPEDPEIHLDIKGLTALSQSLRNLGTLYDSRFNSRLNQDVDILLRSLQHTLRRVRAMFSETRWIRNGQRLYRLAWQDMCYEMTNSEHGQNLNARLGIYQLFVNDMTEALERRQLPLGEMSRHRSWIAWLLNKQEPIEEQLNSLMIDPSRLHLRRNSYTAYSRQPDLIDTAWDDRWGTSNRWQPETNGYVYDTGSPTFSSSMQSAGQTFMTNSSGTAVNAHWAQTLFANHRLPTNDFQTRPGTTLCHGKPEHGLVERLRQHLFQEVHKVQFPESELTARFYCRQRDRKCRLLISTIDQLGAQVRFCSCITELRLVRQGNLLHLWRRPRPSSAINGAHPHRLVLWATLAFQTYEKLVLFHCIFVAMKHQDDRYRAHPDVRDWPYESPQGNEPGERQIFSAPIEDGGYTHALRVYYDHCSGASRLETRPCTGNMKFCPIWTAFISEHCALAGWARKIPPYQVHLTALKVLVFCDSYTPTRWRNDEALLTFTKSRDADDFLRAIAWLRGE